MQIPNFSKICCREEVVYDCVRMCINLYSYASVHMRVRVHMRGCEHDECV